MSKTIADIARELREYSDKQERLGIYDLRNLATDTLRVYADCIEAEHKHKREATCEKSSQVGNAAKAREALELCDKIMSDVVLGVRDIGPLEAFDEMGGIIDQALADPPRNCDVGTPREQELRMDEWCHNGKDYCRCGDEGCPNCNMKTNCVFDWLQMPYNEGGAE